MYVWNSLCYAHEWNIWWQHQRQLKSIDAVRSKWSNWYYTTLKVFSLNSISPIYANGPTSNKHDLQSNNNIVVYLLTMNVNYHFSITPHYLSNLIWLVFNEWDIYVTIRQRGLMKETTQPHHSTIDQPHMLLKGHFCALLQ